MELNDLTLAIGSIIVLICVLTATAALIKHLVNMCMDKLAEAEKLKFERRKYPAEIRTNRKAPK